MGYTINPFALLGCNEEIIPFFQFDVLFWVLGVGLVVYGMFEFLSPFNIIPADSALKYLVLSWDSAYKPDYRHEWDIVSSTSCFFAGVTVMEIGLFYIWATETRDDYTFFTVLVISNALTLACWTFIYMRYRDEWKPMFFSWGISYTVSLVLSIVVLVQQDTDVKQLVDGRADDGVNPGTILWVLFALQGATVMTITMAAFVPSVEQFLFDLHLKSGYEQEIQKTFYTRFLAYTQVGYGLILLWAAYTRHEYDYTKGVYNGDLTLLLVVFINCALGLLFFTVHNVLPGMEDAFANHAQSFLAFFYTCVATASFIAWLVACEVEV